MLNNKGAERAVLSGLCRFGFDAYIDIADIVDINCFYDNKNQMIFKVIENLFEKDHKKIDIPSINSESQSCGVYDRICKNQIDQEYIRSLFNYPIEIENVRNQAKVLARLTIARRAQEAHKMASDKLNELSGNESIDDIVKVSEGPFMDLMSSLTDDNSYSKIGEEVEEYLEYLENNTDKSVGVHTPFPIYNHVIGDGLRPGVHLIAARLKVGKMQPYSSIVYTPDGKKNMGDLKVGDKVLTPFDDFAYVTEVFEHGEKDVYRLNFIDGSYMECGLEHIVEYTTRKAKYFRTKHLFEILHEGLKSKDGHYKFEIRLTKPLNFRRSELVIKPYEMGILLSDKKTFDDYSQKDMLLFYDIEKWKNRRIPEEYLHSSLEDRWNLFKGLLDGNGNIEQDDKKFYSESESMLQDFIYLSRSLGAYSRIMDYKEQRYAKANFTRKTKTLISVEKVRKETSRCIKISEEHGLYVTDNFTVTHNSTVGKEVALHAANSGVPALYIDTEMQYEDQLKRVLSSMTGINIRRIEKGLYKDSKEEKKKVLMAAQKIKDVPFFHKNVSGRDFAFILAYIKRWVHKHVGFDENGKPNKHLIIYDYFKLMDPKSLKDASEYQLMGFQIAALHDFCMQYNTPVLSFVQTNRDGITKDGADVISQSDRLGWNAISLSILRRKTSEEIAVDGPHNGNAKIVPLEGRFMERMDDGDYINVLIDGSIAKIKEISTKNNPKIETGFDINEELTE